MKTRFSKLVRFLSVLCFAVWALAPPVSGQTPAGLSIQTYAGLTITGSVGTVYLVEYVTDLAQTNTPSAWHCLEFLQLPASPYLWADRSAPATAQRFYRGRVFAGPTNMVFIPPGTFRIGSPTNEVDRVYDEGPQTDVIISRGSGGIQSRRGLSSAFLWCCRFSKNQGSWPIRSMAGVFD